MALPEEFLDLVQRPGQHVDLLRGVVEPHGGARRGGDAEALHQRLGAVMADADRHALAVDDGADVMGVDAVQGEGDDL